jgi:hypothetical protein
MIQTLAPHPSTPCPAVERLQVEVRREAAALRLRYVLSGMIADLAIPPPASPTRRDELWKHTCFEAFVRPLPGEAYVELNLAPSTEWAAYAFDSYREAMRPAEIPPPRLAVNVAERQLELLADLRLDGLDDRTWALGLSAVIEAADGSRAYWALRHPQGRPDFHHADCFALELPPTQRP